MVDKADMDKVDKYYLETPAPEDYDKTCRDIEEFCKRHNGKNPIVMVTSGGTTVPMEHNTVR